jgi:diguanylate cyclase (GGDEF)-like protein/PAS domain S-box-containing protein
MSSAEPGPSSDYDALLQFVYMAPVGIAQLSITGDILLANPLAAQLLMPLVRDGNLANLFTVLEQVAPNLGTMVQNFAPSTGLICDAMRIQLGGGSRPRSAPQILSLTLLKLDDTRLMSVLSNITEQVKREKALQQHEAWLSALLTDISDYALVSLDVRGCVQEWNASIGRVTGYDTDAVVGKPYSVFYPPGATTPELILDRLHEAADDGWSLDEGWRQRADGSRFWGNALITPIQAVERAGTLRSVPTYCLVIRDISDKRDASESIRRETLCDYLTGLANRRCLYDTGEIEIARWKRAARPLSLIVIDADHFKQINDCHGHPVGDTVLRHLAAVLTSTFRSYDVVARIGGEEFAVLLPSTTMQDAVALANALLRSVASSTVRTGGADVRYTVSAGVALMSAEVTDLDDLMKTADLALYAAKRAGRNQVAQA